MIRKSLFLGFVILASIITVSVVSERTVLAYEPVSEKIQAIFMAKVIGFIRELGEKPRSDVIIGVLGGGSLLSVMKKSVERIKTDVTIKEVDISNLDGIQILFIPINTGSDLVRQAKTKARGAKILTVGGDPQFVPDYDLTLSFHLSNGRPKMLINTTSSAEEGVKFSSRLLAISDLEN